MWRGRDRNAGAQALPHNTRENEMLIGIPSILGPELLFTLRSMGHGDEIAIVDGNYPALEHARRLIRADGTELLPMLAAILKVMPLDRAVPDAIFRSCLNGNINEAAPIHQAIDAACARACPGISVRQLSGTDLYPRIRAAHSVVATGEPLLFANVILRKGVIEAAAAA
jgi:L-fucose mutarotase